MNKVLFICTGNYFRSRFAEIYFNFLSQNLEPKWLSFSRGTNIHNNNNIGLISPHATEFLASLNVPIPKLMMPAKELFLNDLSEAPIIIALNEDEHRPMIQNAFPEWENKVRYWDIQDIHLKKPTIALQELATKVTTLVRDL